MALEGRGLRVLRRFIPRCCVSSRATRLCQPVCHAWLCSTAAAPTGRWRPMVPRSSQPMQSINQAVVMWEYASRCVGVDRCEGALSGFSRVHRGGAWTRSSRRRASSRRRMKPGGQGTAKSKCSGNVPFVSHLLSLSRQHIAVSSFSTSPSPSWLS